MEEGEWIRRIQEGETQYLTPLIDRHYAGIQKYCCWRIRDNEEAKDLTQETFYRFCRHIESYTNTGKCRAYLYTIARHLCNDHMKKRPPLSWEEAKEATDRAALQSSCFIEEQVEREQLVHELLQLLPDEQRELVFMRYCLDLTFRDIARITGVNVCMVQYRVKRGLVVLRRYLQRSESGEQELTTCHHRGSKELPLAPR
ncbi:RNA polymerase sigma-70 factor (ECF subfamily) [Paenibacillus forsythiae]|uniref:RNA polymerase sigma-70 factor (ECF subfamily) n=1 Tax=Paenibacillus forsythiae TaxID=365616 RepID=A0ABU3H3N3_9BACL|nr:sigma-70 family RNA polymerase sigma factor [Paenibacillus forsythiae]MDT3424637.1 RNA polymerase sigma-70 factor (ECF subfamily) [Paenibacillus forsythiae]